MRQHLLLMFIALLCVGSTSAQYGNEWIDFDKTYYKFSVAEDGIYRIPQSVLANAGLGNIPGFQFRLYLLGEEIAIYTSTAGIFSGSDFIEFYGVRNRGELDRALFEDPDAAQLNPLYSMFSDTSTYFLTWEVDGSGKRITGIPNDLSNPPAVESYYMHKEEWVYSDRSLDPRNAFADTPISLSRYQESEGFASTDIDTFQFMLSSSLVVTDGPDGQFDLRFSSSTYTSHSITALFGSDTLLGDGNSSGFHLYHLQKSVASDSINANEVIQIQDAATNGAFCISAITWTYPREYDFTGRNSASFVHPSQGAAQYFELPNFAHGNADPVVYDRASGVRLIATRNGNTVRFLLPAHSGERDIIVKSQADQIHTISSLTARTFTDYSGDNTEYIIITHPSLRVGADVVAQYAQYRSSPTGGGYNVNIYNILDLYDQFGYGVVKHPQAIRNFNSMIRDHWDAAKMVLIIGKGIVYTISRSHGSEGEQHLLVPTYGHPGADHLLFTENGISLPRFPVGRLPVSDPAQLEAYLTKVMEYDLVTSLPQSLEDRGWTKHILHMGGGADASQQAQILNFLDQMGNNAINSPFGAYISTFTKSSTNTTGVSNSDQIINILQSGVSVVKFFGHSSASTLDFQINNPRDWENKGKYPIFSAMGCRAGDIHQDFLSLSENFVFEPNAGTIAFVAGSGSQYLNTLGAWGKDWYTAFGHGVNNLTLGETILNSLSLQNQFGTLSNILLIEQQTLTGDPALRFYSTPGPDYVWDYQSVKYAPDILTTNEDQFTLSADVVNIGTAHSDTMSVKVEQKLPNGEIRQIFNDTVFTSGFRTPLNLVLPIELASSGLNTFYLTIDALNEVAELPDPWAEQNNELVDATGEPGFDIYILDNRARATYPQEFAIVTESAPELIVSTTNAFVKGSRVVIEIDTTAQFNSPLVAREFFERFGGTYGWKPSIQFIPNVVYYWRVSVDSLSAAQGYNWDVSSFLYAPGGQRGWNQSHYYQFLRNEYDGLRIEDDRQFRFAQGIKNVWIQNAVNVGPFETFNYFVDNTNNPIFYRDWNDTEAMVFVSVYDTVTGKTVKNPPGGAYGAINPFNKQMPVFPFLTNNPDSRNALMTFIQDIIPTGHYVVLHTYQRTGHLDYNPEQWESDSILFGRNIFSVIESIYPESAIRQLRNGSVPYTLLFRKGYGAIQEQIAINVDATINADFNIPVVLTDGNILSRTIGPATQWSKLEWSFTGLNQPMDEISILVYGLNENGETELLVDTTTNTDIDLTWIDAQQYPYLIIKLTAQDPSDIRTAPQLLYWRVLFEGKPELLFITASMFMFHHDSLQLGDSLHFVSSVQNISAYPSSEMEIIYTIRNRFNQATEHAEVLPALIPGASTIITFGEQITDTDGEHLFLVELNPHAGPTEVHHFNNFGLRPFYVIPDRVDPTLDVTFDGRHLIDGDVIAAQPVVIITLHDENLFLPITDPNYFELYLEGPDDFAYTRIDLSTEDITFIPSNPSLGVTSPVLIWRPMFLEDGIYALRITARDAVGNRASVQYDITFEIIEPRYLLDVIAAPNPFSDQTRFTFVLTGHTPPAHFTLRIFDFTGKVVKEFDQSDLGNVFVGTHYSDVIWDGSTEGGSPVPSGVYFYKIEAIMADGKEYGLEKFRGDIGKIIIQR